MSKVGDTPTKVKSSSRAPFKRRTREHIIASISYHWLALTVVRCGHVIDSPDEDYGSDCFISTFDNKGLLEPDFFRVQLKASNSITKGDDWISFQADMRDLRDWERGSLVTILVVFDASNDQAWWLNIQDYLTANQINPRGDKRKTLVLRLPKDNVVCDLSVESWRVIKNARNELIRKSI